MQWQTAVLVLASLSIGAGIVLGIALLGVRTAGLFFAQFAARQAEQLTPPAAQPNQSEGEIRDLLRAERASLRADFAEAIEHAEGVAETVQRHRKKTQQVAQRLEEVEQAPPAPATPDQKRLELVADLKRQGKL